MKVEANLNFDTENITGEFRVILDYPETIRLFEIIKNYEYQNVYDRQSECEQNFCVELIEKLKKAGL